MEKTYKFILPQNKEVEKTNIRIENGEVFVDVEFKERFEPKDGDFLCSNGDCFIYNGKQSEFSYGAYVGVMSALKRIAKGITDNNWSAKENCRYATLEEKAAFLERLEKECGKRWNAEKKCLEDIRWRAEKGESYYYISTALGIDISKDNDVRGDFSEMRHKSNNYFRTHKAAQEVADQIKEIFKNSKAE